MRVLVRHLRSNVIGYLALLVALGGTAYAADQLKKNSVGAKQIKADAVRASELRAGAVTSTEVADQSLRREDLAEGVLSAEDSAQDLLDKLKEVDGSGSLLDADSVDGHDATCPPDTVFRAGLCFESAARGATTWAGASDFCSAQGGSLPTLDQLRPLRDTLDLGSDAASANWTSDVGEDDDGVGVSALTVMDNGGIVPDSAPTVNSHPFRCVFPLLR